MKNSIHCRAVALGGGFLSFLGPRCGLGRENRRVQERESISQSGMEGQDKRSISSILGFCWMLRREWSAATKSAGNGREGLQFAGFGWHNSNLGMIKDRW